MVGFGDEVVVDVNANIDVVLAMVLTMVLTMMLMLELRELGVETRNAPSE